MESICKTEQRRRVSKNRFLSARPFHSLSSLSLSPPYLQFWFSLSNIFSLYFPSSKRRMKEQIGFGTENCKGTRPLTIQCRRCLTQNRTRTNMALCVHCIEIVCKLKCNIQIMSWSSVRDSNKYMPGTRTNYFLS